MAKHLVNPEPDFTVKQLGECPLSSANAYDSAFCLLLGQNVVHAGMTRRTDVLVGF